jgi:alpha-L-fucosidase
VYLHVFDWPSGGRLLVPGLKSHVLQASLLDSRQGLKTERDGANLVVSLPSRAPNTVASVIKLELADAPNVVQALPSQGPDGVIELPAALAAIVNAYGANTRLLGSGVAAYIGGWDRQNTVLNWEFAVREPGTFAVEADAAVLSSCFVRVSCGDNKAVLGLAATPSLDSYRRARLGTITVKKAGEQTIEIASTGKDWSEIRLRGIRLVLQQMQ